MLLEAADLSFGYGRRAGRAASRTRASGPVVIDGVTVSIAAGAAVAILGPNGSGKTTLIKLLSGALAPLAGTVRLRGQPIADVPRHLLARSIAVVPQDTHPAFDYTALEIVLMGRYPRLGAFEIEGPADVAAALDALDATGTRALADRPFPTLSGGEKQRVIIASALAQLAETGGEPLLFLDEPTASLDLRYRLELTVLLQRLNRDRRMTLVLSTHDLALASSLCTHVVLLRHGRILAEGSPAAMLVAPLVAELYGLDVELVAPALP